MPNKTIYVTDEDLPLFHRAQELSSGNLSAAIAKALRRFVDERATARLSEHEEIIVSVGKAGARRRKSFVGRPIGRWVDRRGDQIEVFTAYETRKGRYAVHVERTWDWEYWANPAMWMNPERWLRMAASWWQRPRRHERWQWQHDDAGLGFDRGPGDNTLEVYETIEELRRHVPSDFADVVEEGLRGPQIEKLDI